MKILQVIGFAALFFVSTVAFAEQCKPYPDCKEVLKDPEKYASKHNSTPNDGSLDIMDIISASKSMSCMDWQIVGVCVWLKYTMFSVSIRTSLKVKHYIPDLVISAYQNKGDNPWKLMAWTDDIADITNRLMGLKLKDGNVNRSRKNRNGSSSVKFKNASAIGNPLASVYGDSFLNYLMCKTSIQSFTPYYNSVGDGMLWRTALPEFVTHAADIFTPGKSIVGERDDGEEYLITGRWSNLFPRTGFVSNHDDYKAAATTAARVASLVTDKGTEIHIKRSANAKSKKGYWPAGEFNEYDSKTGKFQMLFPKMENTCHIFGSKKEELFKDELKEASNGKDFDKIKDKYAKKRSKEGNYAWNLWRVYSCCKKEGQVLLMHTGN